MGPAISTRAVVGQAQYVVSDNTRDFPPAQPDGRHVHDNVEYISSTDFIILLT